MALREFGYLTETEVADLYIGEELKSEIMFEKRFVLLIGGFAIAGRFFIESLLHN